MHFYGKLSWEFTKNATGSVSKRINKARKEEVPESDNAIAEEEGIKLAAEAEAAMHDVHDMNYDTIGLLEHIGMLNEDQRRVFEQVCGHLETWIWRVQIQGTKTIVHVCQWSRWNWKSFLIEMIRSQIKEIWKDRVDDDITCAVAAPTGLAAYIVECIAGSTYPLNMRERQLDTGHCLRLHKKQPPLLKLIIIDEVSMLSNLNLAYIHLWLELSGGSRDEYLGSMNILFVGDILQLPPVTGSLVFSKLCNELIFSRMGKHCFGKHLQRNNCIWWVDY